MGGGTGGLSVTQLLNTEGSNSGTFTIENIEQYALIAISTYDKVGGTRMLYRDGVVYTPDDFDKTVGGNYATLVCPINYTNIGQQIEVKKVSGNTFQYAWGNISATANPIGAYIYGIK